MKRVLFILILLLMVLVSISAATEKLIGNNSKEIVLRGFIKNLLQNKCMMLFDPARTAIKK